MHLLNETNFKLLRSSNFTIQLQSATSTVICDTLPYFKTDRLNSRILIVKLRFDISFLLLFILYLGVSFYITLCVACVFMIVDFKQNRNLKVAIKLINLRKSTVKQMPQEMVGREVKILQVTCSSFYWFILYAMLSRTVSKNLGKVHKDIYWSGVAVV